jgi:hypothetical protein
VGEIDLGGAIFATPTVLHWERDREKEREGETERKREGESVGEKVYVFVTTTAGAFYIVSISLYLSPSDSDFKGQIEGERERESEVSVEMSVIAKHTVPGEIFSSVVVLPSITDDKDSPTAVTAYFGSRDDHLYAVDCKL